MGRPPLTDRATLLDAAREVGFAELTVGRVTDAVGVRHSTFYRHFPSVDGLLSALIDARLAEAAFPEPNGSWCTYLAGATTALDLLLDAHPGMAHALLTRSEPPHRLTEVARHATDLLRTAGLGPDDAALVASTAIELVIVQGLPLAGTLADAVGGPGDPGRAPAVPDLRGRDDTAGSGRPIPAGRVDLLILAVQRRLDDTSSAPEVH